MKLTLYRLNDDGDSTIGILSLNNKFRCYTLEDQFQPYKVRSETRIPAGHYQIKQRKVLSGLTKRYRNKYDWFEWHLELQDVPDFKYIYIHSGNRSSDTDGCLIVGQMQESNRGFKTGFVGKSRDAYKELYLDVTRALESGEEVWITVNDEGWMNG